MENPCGFSFLAPASESGEVKQLCNSRTDLRQSFGTSGHARVRPKSARANCARQIAKREVGCALRRPTPANDEHASRRPRAYGTPAVYPTNTLFMVGVTADTGRLLRYVGCAALGWNRRLFCRRTCVRVALHAGIGSLGRHIGSVDPNIGSPHILTRLGIRETSIAHRHFRL